MTTITFSHRSSHAHRGEGRIAGLVAAFAAWRHERRQRSRLAHELANMSDAECHDIGISRADFRAILDGTYRR